MRGRLPKTGKLVGTGAALSVNVGFKPVHVRVFNVTQKSTFDMSERMPAGKGISTVDSGVGTTDIAEVAANGLTLTNTGFKLGTSATLNTASDEIYYVAF